MQSTFVYIFGFLFCPSNQSLSYILFVFLLSGLIVVFERKVLPSLHSQDSTFFGEILRYFCCCSRLYIFYVLSIKCFYSNELNFVIIKFFDNTNDKFRNSNSSALLIFFPIRGIFLLKLLLYMKK